MLSTNQHQCREIERFLAVHAEQVSQLRFRLSLLFAVPASHEITMSSAHLISLKVG